MLRDIVRKEVMENIGTLKFVVTFAVVIVLVISGLVLGSKNYLEQRGDINQQRMLNQKMLESQFDWLNAGWAGIIESKRPYVLTTFDNGIENSLGRQAYVDTLNDTRLDESRNLVSPILAVFGDVDLTFVVKIILSLFVILLTFDAISGEKERGTLKLSLANEVPRHKILLGKALGGFSVIVVAFFLPLVIGLAFMAGFYPQVMADMDGEAWLRFLLILLIYTIYLAVFFALGVFVSSLCHRSSTSFIVLLMIWVLFVTIIPRISLTAVEQMRPYKSYTTLQTEAFTEISQKRADLLKEYIPKFTSAQQRLVAREFSRGATPQASGDDTEFSRMQSEFWRDMTEIQREVMERREAEYKRQQEGQIGLAESISRVLSPTSALSFAVENLAGSGWARQLEYQKQLRIFREKFLDYIFEESAKQKADSIFDLLERQSLDVKLGKISFDFQEERLGDVVSRSVWDIGWLVLLALVFFSASFVAFIRYDVR